MADQLDAMDRNILAELQRDASQSLDEIAQNTGSSKTPVWNRIKKMRARGVIKHDTVVLDPEKLGLEACFFVLSEHEADWQQKFLAALMDRPEVLEAHRLAGDIDYILKVRVGAGIGGVPRGLVAEHPLKHDRINTAVNRGAPDQQKRRADHRKAVCDPFGKAKRCPNLRRAHVGDQLFGIKAELCGQRLDHQGRTLRPAPRYSAR